MDNLTTLSQDASKTLSLFDWVVIQEDKNTLIIGDDDGQWVTTYKSLNRAALTASERQAITIAGTKWEAMDNWCDRWHGERR